MRTAVRVAGARGTGADRLLCREHIGAATANLLGRRFRVQLGVPWPVSFPMMRVAHHNGRKNVTTVLSARWPVSVIFCQSSRQKEAEKEETICSKASWCRLMGRTLPRRRSSKPSSSPRRSVPRSPPCRSPNHSIFSRFAQPTRIRPDRIPEILQGSRRKSAWCRFGCCKVGRCCLRHAPRRGIGWGLVGYCPGPALAALALGYPATALFVSAMLIGMGTHSGLHALLSRAPRHA